MCRGTMTRITILKMPLTRAEGGSNLDLKLIRHKKFLIGGFGGSIRYRPDGTNQYTQTEAYLRAFRMLPRLFAGTASIMAARSIS